MATWHDPAQGYNTFSSAQSDLYAAKQKYDDVILVADAGKSFIDGAWKADGSTVLQANVQTFRDTLPDIQEVLLEARQALIDYHDNLSSIATSAEPWRTQYNNMNYLLNQDDRNLFQDPVGAAQDALDRVQNLAKFDEAKWELQRLYNRRRAADSVVISALSASMPASWADTSAGFAAAGITQSMLLSSTGAKDAMLELATRLAGSSLNDENAEDVAALAAMYDVFGDNKNVMAQFYRELGGKATVELVEAIGEKMPNNIELDVADALARQIREGLSLASSGWTQSNGASFAKSMFEADRGAWSSIGYLFNDPLNAPLGETTAIAAAGIVDEIERAGGSVFQYGSMMGGTNLSYLDYPEDDDEYLRVQDASGPIFSTLGTYPDAAFDFLSDPDVGADRVQYWYEDRQNYDPDKFQGVSDLWLGAEVAGPHDGMTQDDFDRESANLTSRVLNSLVDNQYFVPENISNSASASLGGVFMVNIEAFTEYPINLAPDTYVEGVSIERQLANGESYWSPGVSGVDMSVFLARAGSHPEGAGIITDGVAAYQQILLGIAAESGDPAQMYEAFNKVTALQAAVDGADMGSVIDSAVRSDERTEQMMDTIRDIVGLIPVKGASEILVDGGIWVFDVAQDKLIDGLLEYDTNAWTRQGEFAIDDMYSGVDQREDIARFSIATNLYSMYDGALPGGTVGDLPTLNIEAGDSEAQAKEKLAQYYADSNDWLSNPQNAAAVTTALTEVAGPTATLDGFAGDYSAKYAEYSSYVRDYEAP